ncbi:major facilitator superfamily domain-containing protein [Boeremia exigua]|uniref:major facilitator superfamily domain-containing protein n=1 Tax=Boeremia exigua TaxID=749465 RepID=UPI001E8D2991|nr:major facilitator superfamily domain-containing protein [Boeremia exigua]KAH6638730.1 major facilitator superfamily domain-containing protein [Boeremia exigua]
MLSTTPPPADTIASGMAAPATVELKPHGAANLSQAESLRYSSDDDSEYPEGGATAWSVVLGAFCAMVPSMGLLNTVGVLQAWVSENQLHGYSESTIGWIFSAYCFFLYIGGAQVGPIFDAHDIRYLIVPGSIGIVAAIMCMSVSTEYYQLLLSFGVLGGSSACLLFTPAVSAVGHWFYKRRALAIGIACTAGGVGGVVFPLLILYLAPIIGFPWTMRIVGFVCLFMCIIACLLLKKRLPHNEHAGASIDLAALKDPKYALTTLAVFLIEFSVFVPYSFISLYAIHSGVDQQKAYLISALLNVGAIPGRALPGYVADRFGTFNTMLATSLTCATLIFALWLTAARNEAAITAFAIVFGFWSGTGISLTPVCVGAVCKIEDYGKRNGTTFSIASFAALIGIPAAGAVLEAGGGNYTGLIVFAGGLYLAAFAVFLVTRIVGWGSNWRTIC